MSTRSVRGGLVALLVFACAATARPARAQSEAQIAAAKRAFKEGDEAEKRRDLRLAQAKFKEALAVKETPQLILRLGGVEEKMGLLGEAMTDYERGLDRAQAAHLDAVVKVAREQMDALRARVPTVVVTVAKSYPDLVVKLDDKPLALGTKVYLDPGDHRLVAEATGYQRKDKPFTVVERDALEFQLDLAPLSAPAPAATEPVAPASEAPPPSRSKLPAAVLLGVGGAAIAGGVVMFLVANGKNGAIDDECGGPDRKMCPISKKDQINGDISTVKMLQIFSGVSAGLGLAGVGVGTYLLLRKPAAPAPQAGAVTFFPLAGPTTAGVGAALRF